MIANTSERTTGGFCTLYKGFLIVITKENKHIPNEVAVKYIFHKEHKKRHTVEDVHRVSNRLFTVLLMTAVF